MADEALELVAEVARALQGLVNRVVFIGGAIAPLLQVDRLFRAVRPTDDVDAIAVTVSYTDFDRMREELRSLGFREVMDARHAYRWTAPGPGRVKFDLVPAGEHFGSSGNLWDGAAMDTAVQTRIEEGLTIRHASGPGFLALKLAAFRDRGQDDPFTSTDLEDILSLVASRPRIVDEVSAAPESIRTFVAEQVTELLLMEAFEDLIAGHLANVTRSRAAEIIPAAEGRLKDLAALA